MREKKVLIIICLLAIIAAAILSLGCGLSDGNSLTESLQNALDRLVQTGTADYVIMIDPGHGGMDGGASGNDGTLEKDINLAIAKQLADIAEQYGCTAILTRETDEWLCDTDEGSIRSRKTADLKARRELIRKYDPEITVSIHLNSFKEDSSVKGAQMFYPSEGGTAEVLQECRTLAETMQSGMNEILQPDSPRTAMVRDGVFIFKEVLCPMVIAECGFMSNHLEAGKLKTTEYQKLIAESIMNGIADYAQLKKPETVEIIDSLR